MFTIHETKIPMDIQCIYTNKGDPKYGSCLLQASGDDEDTIVKKKMNKNIYISKHVNKLIGALHFYLEREAME